MTWVLALLCVGLSVSQWGCDAEPASPSSSATLPAPPVPSQPTDEPVAAVDPPPRPETPDAEAPPSQGAIATDEAPGIDTPRAEALPTKPSPLADKETRQALLIAHYRTLGCLSRRGASEREVAEAFEKLGMQPAIWNQALGELLEVLEADPEGDVAKALLASDDAPCASGVAP